MATPVNVTYSVASGLPIYGGRSASSLPAWLTAHPALNEFFQISGTSGAGGASINDWGAIAINLSTSEIYFAAESGHDQSDNRVVSLALEVDAPSYTLRKAGSTPTPDVFYYADGTPTGRHMYHHIQHVPSLGVVMLSGCRFGYGPTTPTGPNMDAFVLATDSWDTGTYLDVPHAGEYGKVIDDNGDIWTNSLGKWASASNTWSSPIITRAASTPREPWAYDSTRSQIFGLCWGDGEGSGSGLVASKVPIGGTVETAVTFNASAAYTAWLAATPAYCGMDYDPLHDWFLFYHDNGTTVVVYKIIPNSGTTWDMQIFSFGAGNDLPVSLAGGAGINGRFKYVPNLNGFVAAPKAVANLYFMRTS